MNCLNSLLFENGMTTWAIAKAGVGTCNIAGISMGVLLFSVRKASASSSLLVKKEL